MEFESGPGSDSYDYQFVKWLAKEKVNAVYVCILMWKTLQLWLACRWREDTVNVYMGTIYFLQFADFVL